VPGSSSRPCPPRRGSRARARRSRRGANTPNAAHAAPLGSKSESCSLLTPSFSLNAPCAQLESQETP
jgi:hypothetical protein